MNIKQILEDHVEWLRSDGLSGQHANLQDVDLQDANLQDANLQDADLRRVNLQDANLQDANLRGADLRGADLRGAHLQRADLQDADLDCSSHPLWCGSVGCTMDECLLRQLVYHAICNMDAEQRSEFLLDPVAYANGFHHVGQDVEELT